MVRLPPIRNRTAFRAAMVRIVYVPPLAPARYLAA